MSPINSINYNPNLPRFYPRQYGIGPEVAAALITGGLGLAGGLFGSNKDYSSSLKIAKLNAQLQRETNDKNLQIARETNQTMVDMQQSNNEFNAEQAQISRAWDTPQEKIRRAMAAGINPYVAASGSLGSGTSQMAAAAGAGAQLHAPTLQAPQIQNVQTRYSRMAELISAFGGTVASLAQAKKAGADAKRVNALLEKELDMFDANIENTREDTNLKELAGTLQERTLNFNVALAEYKKDETYENLNNLREARKKLQNECKLITQQILESQARTDLLFEQAGTEVVKRDEILANIDHLKNLDQYNRDQLAILWYNAATGRYSAETAYYVAHNPTTVEAFLLKMLTGAAGADAGEIGAAVWNWLKKNVPKFWHDFKDKPVFKVVPPDFQ